MPLASLAAIADELDLARPEAVRVSRFLPEAERHLRAIKGQRWYDAVAALPPMARPPIREAPAVPPPPGTPPPGPGVPSAVALVLDGPPAGATVGVPVFLSGSARSSAGVRRVEVRYTENGVPGAWRELLVAETHDPGWPEPMPVPGPGPPLPGPGPSSERVTSAPGWPTVRAFGVLATLAEGPAVVEWRATGADGGVAVAARAYLVVAEAPVLDEAGPVLVVDSPRAGATVTGGVLTVLGRASDPAGVVSVRGRVNGGAWRTLYPSVPDEAPDATLRQAVGFAYVSSLPGGGVAVVDLEATDGLANVSAWSQSVMVEAAPVGEAGGEVVIDAPRPGATVAPSFVVHGRLSAPEGAAGAPAVEWRDVTAGGPWADAEAVVDVAHGAVFGFAVEASGGAPGETRAQLVEVRATWPGASGDLVRTRALSVGVSWPDAPVPSGTVTVDRPTVGALVSGPTVIVAGRASDPSGVTAVELRLDPSDDWEPVTWAGDTLAAWVRTLDVGVVPFERTYTVEVRATYGDTTSQTSATAFVVRASAPPSAPSLTLSSPGEAATVQPPAVDLRGTAHGGGGTVARVEYRATPSGQTPGSWVGVAIPAGQVSAVFGVGVPVTAAPNGQPRYVTLEVRTVNSLGETASVGRSLRVVQAAPSAPGPNDDRAPAPVPVPDDGPVYEPTKEPTEWEPVPAEFAGAFPPPLVAPTLAEVLASAEAPARLDGRPAQHETSAATSKERRDAERAECLLALYHGLPVLNVVLAPGGGVLAQSWTRSETGTTSTRFASEGELDGVRRDLLTSAQRLVDGDVRVLREGSESGHISGIEGLGGGAAFFGAI